MTREQEIEERLKEAGPGPWRAVNVEYAPGSEPETLINDADGFNVLDEPKDAENVSLIIHAPADLRYLLDKIQRWRNACPRVLTRLEAHCDTLDQYCECGDHEAVNEMRKLL